MRLHPYIVHFAVGLILMSVVLFVAGTVLRNRSCSASLLGAARWNLWIGAGFALASIASGFVDYISIPCDQAAIDATVLHRRSGAVTWWSSLIAGIAAYRTRQRPPGMLLVAGLMFVAVAAMTATKLGTDLTYSRGLGVEMAWPGQTGNCLEQERQPRK